MHSRFPAALALLFVPFLLAPVVGPAPGQIPIPRFRTWKTNPAYYHPAYPLLFVASYRDASLKNSGNLGTDAVEVGVPQGGQELWIMLTDGEAKKLFPIQGVHDSLVDESLAPENGRILGAVIEPSISIDGKRAYFTYFHNATDFPPFCCTTPSHSSFDGWAKGGDLYVIDLEPLLDNISFPVENLVTSRLTETPAGTQFEHAMNPILATITGTNWPAGVVYTGAVEIDNAYGRQLLFASTRRMLGNSNARMHRTNKNYNLFTADIKLNGNNYVLRNIKQAQYYTTTSAVTPFRLRAGYAFSYQSNTEEPRQWHIQQVVGHEWRPLYGYGIGNELAHMGTFCVKSQSALQLPAGDYAVVTRYYNQNNNGFGAVFAQPMAKAGFNRYVFNSSGWVPWQVDSVKITSGVPTGDEESDYGKFVTPACGGPDELYLAYDPGTANHQDQTIYNYQPRIVFNPLEAANPVTQPGAYQTVIKGRTDAWAALWPLPVIDWSHRLTGIPDPNGDAQQERPPSPIEPSFSEILGKPYALVGTSALYNTDVTPVDCRTSAGYYDPFVTPQTGPADNLYNNIDGLSRLMHPGPGGNITNQTGTCTKPTSADVFGIAIYMTSTRTSENTFNPALRGYITDGGGFAQPKESKRLLGVFEQGMLGRTDTSFTATIPANVPLDFQLIGANGAKLADVRSWHSLKPREARTNCGGCHNHREGQSVPWNPPSLALPPLDMVRETTRIEYDASCQPTLVTLSAPVDDVPTWQDVSAGFHSYCGDCHRQNSGNTNATNALSYDPTKLDAFNSNGSPASGNPLVSLFARKYIDPYSANGSPMFWAAYGDRTDGRNNLLLQYQPQHLNFSTCTDTTPRNCGYVYTVSHDNLPICDVSDPEAARWVYKLSQWIDNHAPANVPGQAEQYHSDRYHPSVEGAFIPGSGCNAPSAFNVGVWDDSGSVVLDVKFIGLEQNDLSLNNDVIHTIPLNGNDLAPFSHMLVKVTATDAANNRQIYEKTIGELIQECDAATP